MKIKNTLILSLLCFSLIPILVFFIYVQYSLEGNSLNMYKLQMQEVVDNQAFLIEDYLTEMRDDFLRTASFEDAAVVAAQSNDNTTSDFRIEEIQSWLQESKSENASVEAVFIMNLKNTVVASTNREDIGASIDQATADSYKKISVAQKQYMSGVFQYTIGNTTSCVFAFAKEIRSSDAAVQGYLVEIVNTKHLQDILYTATFAKTGNLFLIDQERSVFAAPFSYADSIASVEEYTALWNQYSSIPDAGSTPDNCFVKYIGNYVEKLAYVYPVQNEGWFIVGTMKEDEIISSFSITRNSIVFVLIPLAILTITLGLVGVRSSTHNIRNINTTLQKIKRGDYEARFEEGKIDEYNEISQALNGLVEDIIVSDGRYRTIVEMSDSIIFEWNFQEDKVFIANNFNRKFSYRAPTDCFEDSFLNKMNIHREDVKRYREDLELMRKGDVFLQNEYRMLDMFGGYIWMLMRTASISDREGKPLKAVGVMVDINRGKRAELLLRQRASYDSLTELYNRGTFERSLMNEIELSVKRNVTDAIMFIDIDDFKNFNDKYGHAVGDEVLRFTASCIRKIIGENGFAGRYGGDEFVLCIQSVPDRDTADQKAVTLLELMKKGYYSGIAETTITVKCSIGIALLTGSGKTYEDIIKNADAAMYKIKTAGKCSYGYI